MSHVLLLAPYLGGTGGIERATRGFAAAVCDLLGDQGLTMVSLPSGAAPGRHLPPIAKARFAAAALRAARVVPRGALVAAAHVGLAPLARVCATATRGPLAIWCYGIEVWGRIPWTTRAALRAADRVLAISAFTATEVTTRAGVEASSVRVVHPASDRSVAPRSSGVLRRPESGTIVLTVSRLDPEQRYKGVDALITAWPQVVRQVPAAELVVVGDGPDRARLGRVASLLGVEGAVHFVGGVPDEVLRDHYREASVFALPARFRFGPRPAGEGFGLVYVEAAAAGLPVVAARGGAVEEVVQDGRTGLLVSPSDPTEIAGTIVRLLTDPVLARHLGEEGQAHAEQAFSPEAYRGRVAAALAGLA